MCRVGGGVLTDRTLLYDEQNSTERALDREADKLLQAYSSICRMWKGKRKAGKAREQLDQQPMRATIHCMLPQ